VHFFENNKHISVGGREVIRPRSNEERNVIVYLLGTRDSTDSLHKCEQKDLTIATYGNKLAILPYNLAFFGDLDLGTKGKHLDAVSDI
jgi:hypothetical protein